MPVKDFGSFGKSAKDVLGGYSYESLKLTAAPSLPDKLADLKYTTKLKGDTVAHEVKCTATQGSIGKIEATLTDKAAINLSVNPTVPVKNLKVTVAGNPADLGSFKGTFDFANDAVAAKLVSTLTAAPVLDASVAAPVTKDISLGASASFDVTKAALTKYGGGLTWASKNSSVAVLLEDKLGTVKALVGHSARGMQFASEIGYKTASGDVSACVGAQWTDRGVTCKGKVDKAGVVELSAETAVNSHKFGVCAAFNALKGGDAKYGLSLDLKP